jgi:replicative DNA helicase
MVEGFDMKILYVDYLQLLSSKHGAGNRATEVQAISRTLKEIAMDNKIPVVSLCQFNRSAGQANIYDILSHLKESSGIEQDASTILYIQIEKTDQPKQVKDAKLTVLKNRNGATFKPIDLHYRGETFTFSEFA